MRRLAPLFAVLLAAAGCIGGDTGKQPRASVFVGVDVSGSFYKAGHYDEALEFLAYYLYGHLRGLGELQPVKTLFVGTIGGNSEEETKSFHPIQDFSDKSVEQMVTDLKAWYPKANVFTDFNVFFREVANISQKRNLSLSPITIILLTDGIPDVRGPSGEETTGKVETIDVSPLEYLSRRVTLRVLYPDPPMANKWENAIPRQRVLMWTVDQQVMSGWKNQLIASAPPEKQEKLWKWVADNVDFRVRADPLRMRARRKSE